MLEQTSTNRLIAFDWDGTLMNSFPAILEAMRLAVAEKGMQPIAEETLAGLIGLSVDKVLAVVLPTATEAQKEDFVQSYRAHFRAVNHLNALYPEAETVLQQLVDAGFTLAVATSKSRQGLEEDMAEFNLSQYFTFSRCGDETRGKPQPDMLLEILAHCQLPAEAAIMVGDTEYDMQMAQLASVKAIAVTQGYHDHSRLVQYSPIKIISTIAELPQHI